VRQDVNEESSEIRPLLETRSRTSTRRCHQIFLFLVTEGPARTTQSLSSLLSTSTLGERRAWKTRKTKKRSASSRRVLNLIEEPRAHLLLPLPCRRARLGKKKINGRKEGRARRRLTPSRTPHAIFTPLETAPRPDHFSHSSNPSQHVAQPRARIATPRSGWTRFWIDFPFRTGLERREDGLQWI